MKEQFLQIPNTLISNKTIINSETGESVRLTHLDVLLYRLMFSRYTYFSSQGNDYYDTQDQLAALIDASRPAIVVSTGRLKLAGVLTVVAKRIRGCQVKNIYTVFDFKTVDGKNFSCNKQETKVESLPIKKTKPIVKNVVDLEDEPY